MLTPEFVITIGRQALELTLLVSAPMLLAAMGIGLIVSIFQAATQINEQTMTFIPKIAGVMVALIIFAPWMIQKLLAFTRSIFEAMAGLGG